MKKFIVKHKTDGSTIGTFGTKKEASEFVLNLVELNKIDNVFNVECEEQDIDDYPLTFDDACTRLGITGSALALQGDNNLAKSAVAFYKLAIIAKAWNKIDDFIPDFSNTDQYKYFPWFTYSPKHEGLVYMCASYSGSSTIADFGSLICFKSYSMARKFGETFADLYNEMFF